MVTARVHGTAGSQEPQAPVRRTPLRVLAALLLAALHATVDLVDSLWAWVSAVWPRLARRHTGPARHKTSATLAEIAAQADAWRQKTPHVLCLAFAETDVSLKEVAHAATWGFAAGIETIVVWDKKGHLVQHRAQLEHCLGACQRECFEDRAAEFSVTVAPPTASAAAAPATSSSRTLHVAAGGHDAFIEATRKLCVEVKQGELELPPGSTLEPAQLAQRFPVHVPSPDLVILFSKFDCLYGMLPWQMQAAEIIRRRVSGQFRVGDVLDCLARYARSEQRCGK
eukprot:m.183952 g.183952  ORF g.183952 m.183952 type:complete len:283 (+) comp18090_c0_seq2:368-1216(+)